MDRKQGWWVRIGLLVLLPAVVWPLAYPPPVSASGAALTDPRAHAWTFTAAAFQPGPDGYLSPAGRAPFPFTAAAVHLKPSGIAAFFIDVELRLRADGGDWSPWYLIDELEPQADGRLYGDNLVAWPQAHEVQVRVRSASPLPEAIEELVVVAIDTHDGPTAAQAALAAWARTAGQATLTQDDAGAPRPTIISRAEWGANESWMSWSPAYVPVDKVIVHHTVSGGGSDPAAEVRAVYYYHAVIRGWGDIGYNFLVDRFGNIYEGRYGGPDVVGAHVSYWNEASMGLSVLGCYDNGACSTPQVPTGVTLNALADLVAWTASRQTIDPRERRSFSNGYSTVTNYVLAGHRDYGFTTCPGDNLYATLPNLRQMAWERLPEYDVRFGWHNTPSSLDAGQQVTVYPNLYNYGRLEWSDAGGVRLGYRWLREGQVVAENTAAARIIPSAVVSFGEMTALVAQLSAPNVPGTFTLRWDLYRDGVGWFADQPAPAGRSSPLDLTVEVAPVLSLEVQLEPLDVSAGTQLETDITVQGITGQAFEARMHLPAGIRYVVGSGRSDLGSLYADTAQVVWSGTLDATTARASFNLMVSSDLHLPVALLARTTLNVAGYAPLTVERWLIANGYHGYLPLVQRARMD